MSAFIGREQDLIALHGYLQDALQGKGKVVFIVGEAGIGKTRLIEEFKAQCLDAHNEAMQSQKTSKVLKTFEVSPDIRFADAKCNELAGKGEPYAPFFEIIAQFVADDKAFGSSKLAEIVREVGSDWFELVPVIGKALSLISKTFFKWRKTDDVRQLADRQVQKEKLVQEFTHILKRMSDEHPLVLFLDDLHWADESSISLLFHAARHLQEQRILILGTYRPTDIEAARGDKAHPLKDVVYELHRYDLCATIKLGYLTQAQVQDFLDAYLGQHDLDAAFATYLYDLTEGNPLFVTEYVKLLQEIGKLALCTASVPLATDADPSRKRDACGTSDNVWKLRGTLRDADMPIPTSVEKVIEKRVERLKEELQKTLKYASVNGEQFNTLVLAKLLNWDELDLLEKLGALARVHQLVKEINLAPGQTPRGAVYQFIHSLVQKSLYATLSAGIKSKLHAKAAEILEEVYHDDLETVAEELVEHYSRGQNHAQAAKYALLAARKANRQSGFQEARAHAQRGLECLKTANPLLGGARGGSDQAMLRLQIELLLELATAEEAIGEAKNSIDHAETAEKLVERVNDQSFQGDVLYQVGTLLLIIRSSDYERIFQLLEQSLALKILTREHEYTVKILEQLSDVSWSLGKGDYFIVRCQEIMRINQQAQKEYLNVTISKLAAMIFYNQGKYQEAYDSASEGLKVALVIGDQFAQIELLRCLVEYAVHLGNVLKASEYYEQAKILVSSIVAQELKGNFYYLLGQIAWYLNKYDEALENFHISKDIAHQNQDLWTEGTILSVIMEKCQRIGRFENAIKFGMECLEVRQKLGRVNEIIRIFDHLGYTLRYKGEYVKALEMREKAIMLSRKYGRERRLVYCLVGSYYELLPLGKFHKAIEYLTEALSICQKLKDVSGEIDCLTNSATAYFYSGRFEESLERLNIAKNIDKINIPHKGYLMRYSQLLIGQGNYKEAHTILENTITDNILKKQGFAGDSPIHLINSAQIYLVFDELEKCLKRLQEIEEYFKKHVFMEATAMLKDAYAQVYLAQGEFEKAESSLNEAIALFQQMNSFRRGEADLTLAALRLAQGQPEAALQAAEDARKIFQEIEYYRRGEAMLWEAKSHLALRHFPETRERLAAANAIFSRQQQPHHAAEAKLVEGQLLLAETGDTAQALTLFTEAKATFDELGLNRLANEANHLINTWEQQ